MKTGKPIWLIRRVVLLLGIAALLIMILRMIGGFSEMPPSPPSQPITVSPSNPAPSSAPPNELEFRGDTPNFVEGDSSVVETPADAWANAILDQIVATFKDQLDAPIATPPKQSAYEGMLSMEADNLAFGGNLLAVNTLDALAITVIQALAPEHSLPLGSITVDRDVLILTSSESSLSQDSREWRLSNAAPALALQALLSQAQLRNLRLEASFQAGLGGEAQVNIYDASHANTPRQATSSTEAITQPTIESSPSPTRIPDIVLSRLIATKIDPVIDELHNLPPSITAGYLDRYARSGILTTTETEIQIAGRSIPVDEALDLTIYTIDTTATDGSTIRLLTAYYSNEATTRFPEEQVYFQGHRMRETLYWIVTRAVERGGQLIVGYDEFAQIQGVTLIGFKSFPEP